MTIVYQPSKSYLKIPEFYSTYYVISLWIYIIYISYIKHISYSYLKIYCTLV